MVNQEVLKDIQSKMRAMKLIAKDVVKLLNENKDGIEGYKWLFLKATAYAIVNKCDDGDFAVDGFYPDENPEEVDWEVDYDS